MNQTTPILGLAAIVLGLAVATPAPAQPRLAAIDPTPGAGQATDPVRRMEALVAEHQKLVAQSPRSPALPLLMRSTAAAADLHERMGNDARALALCQAALAAAEGSIVPGQYEMRARVGELQNKTGAFADATRTYQAMLTAPGSELPMFRATRFKVYAGLGKAALGAGDDAVAEANLLLAIAEDPAIAGQPQGAGGGNATLFDVQAAFSAAIGRVAELQASMDAQRAVMGANGELVAAANGLPPERRSILAVQGALTDLAQLYYRKGDAAALKRLYDGQFGAYATRAALAGKGDFGPSAELEKQYARFGAYFAGLRQGELAEHAFGQALRLNARRLAVTAVQVQPELLAGSFEARRQILDLLLSLRLAQGDDARRWRPTLGELLQGKGLQGEFMARRARVIGTSRDREVRRLAAEMEAIDGREGAEQNVRRWNLGAALQAKVGKTLPPLAFEDGERFLARVEQQLGAATLVSVSTFSPFDFAAQRFGAPRYLGARIGTAGVLVADLGPAAALDAAGARLRADLGRRPQAGAGPAAPASARIVHDALLKPLLGAQAATGSHVADLDGALSLLPMEALFDGKRYLIDNGEWRYVSSARALLRDAAPHGAAGESVVLAAPAYDLEGAAPRAPRFAPLPQTLEEGNAVAAALRRGGARVALHTGADASMAVLERLRSPRHLHIATHGFFVEEAGSRTEQATGSDGARYLIENQAPGRSSGLALAGANTTPASGVMYAAQLRQLDLSGTELAVLSACETAVGAVHPGEGVDSLRQALEIAGARSMVTSLWSVPDVETQVMMTDFYNGLADGASKPGALRNAKLRMKQRQAHPFYWASFVATGMP